MHEMHNFDEDNIKISISKVTVNDFILDEYTLLTNCARYKPVKLLIDIDTGYSRMTNTQPRESSLLGVILVG